MRIERYVWLSFVLTLLVLCGLLMRQKSALEHSFLASEFFGPIKSDAIGRFEKDEGVTVDKINGMFFVSYAYFRNQVCIRFVPRPKVYGGVTSYCYRDHEHIELLSIDRTGG